jgi:hypothetical protein
MIDLHTGETIRKIRAARSLHDSPYEKVQFLDGMRPRLLDDRGNSRFDIHRTSFAFLGVIFAPGLLALSESGGPLRCLEINRGKEMWKYTPPLGNHILHVGYCENNSRFMAIEWPYEKGGPKRLLQLSEKNGSILGYIDLGEPIDCCFAFSGKFLVTTSGDVIDTATGTATKISS